MPPRPDQTNSPFSRYMQDAAAIERASWPSSRPSDAGQRRASQVAYPRASAVPTVAFEPLVVDLDPPLPGTHWVVSYISAMGVFTVNAPAQPFQGPTTGLFLVAAGTNIETLGEGQSSAGWLSDRRGIVIPCRLDLTVINPAPGNAFAYACLASLSSPLVVTAGLTIRFLANVNPGTPQPGPGVGSTATLRAVCTIEQDRP